MILLKSLELNNFLSHESTTIEFEPNERLLIDGKSGAGKSAVVDAVIWALYNKGRVQNRSLIRRGAKTAFVKLEIVSGDTIYLITRSITAKGEHKVEIMVKVDYGPLAPLTVAGTRNLQDFIEKEIVGCSYSLFINSVCYPQDNLDSFVRQTPAKRKDLLLELLRTARYDQLYEKCKTVITDISNKVAALDERNAYLNLDLTASVALADAFDMYKKQAGVYEEIISTIDKEVNEIRLQNTKVMELNTLIKICALSIEELNQKFVQQMTRKEDIQKKLEAIKVLDITYLNSKKERFEQLMMDSNSIVANLTKHADWQNEFMALMATKPQERSFGQAEEITNQINLLKGRELRTELCPECGKEHKCDLIQQEVLRQIRELEQQLIKVEEEKQIFVKDIQLFQSKVSEMQAAEPHADTVKLSEIQEEMRQLKPLVDQYHLVLAKEATIENYNQIILDCEEEGKSLTIARASQVERMNEHEKAISGLHLKYPQEKIPELIKRQEEVKASYMDVLQRLTLAQAAKQKVKDINKDKVENDKKKLALTKELETMLSLKEAFGTNGIKAMVLDYAIPQLEDRINNILEQLSAFKVALNTQKLNVEGDSTIEGLFISIFNEKGEEFDFDSYSGGERLKVTISIAEGLAELQKINFRILDEAVIGLDSESSNQFANIILAFKERFQQLICISHMPIIKDLFEDRLEVVKLDGVSKVS